MSLSLTPFDMSVTMEFRVGHCFMALIFFLFVCPSFPLQGDYESSRAVNFGNALYMDRIAQRGSQQRVLSRWVRDVKGWDKAVHQEQQSEVLYACACGVFFLR